MFRAFFSAFTAIARFLAVAPIFAGLAAWQSFVAFMTAIRPQPATPADAIADGAEAALAQDDAVVSVEERRAAREAKRAQAALSPEIAQAAAEGEVLRKVQVVAAKPAKFKHVKPKELRGIIYWDAPKAGQDESPIREATRWLYNSLCPLPAYEVAPTLNRLSPELKAWFTALDRDQRKCVCTLHEGSLTDWLVGTDPAKWYLRPGVPHLNKAHRDAHRAWVAAGNRGGIWSDPVTGVMERLHWDPPAKLQGADEEYGAYVPVRRR